MIKRLALLTSVAMAVTPAAYAQSSEPTSGDRPYDDRPYDDRTFRDRSYDDANQQHGFYGDYLHQWSSDDRNDRRDYRWQSGWVRVASGVPANTPRQYIAAPRGERLHWLRIQSERGAPLIRGVIVQFRDGSTERVRLNTRLPRGVGQVVKLNRPRAAQRIIVLTNPRYGGAYSVFAT